MTAIPVYFAESLAKARGLYGHGTAEQVKGAAYGIAPEEKQE